MPSPGLTDTSNPRNGARVVLMDYKGGTHSQFIPTAGGEVNGDAHRDLAVAIARCSNAALFQWSKIAEQEANLDEMDAYDEAEASVERQLIMVFQHKSIPGLSREVVIAAYDASLLLPDMATPDMTKADLIAVRDQALDLINDDGNALNPGDYRFARAFTTTRKVGKRTKGTQRALPSIAEPSPTANPGGGPASTP